MIKSFKNYLVSPSGIVSIIAILLAFYFFWQGQEKPLLTLYQDDNQVMVVSSENTSDLKVFFKDKKITNGLYSSQIIIWNAGDENIKKDMVLDPIEISIEPKTVDIYEVNISDVTRDLIDFKIDNSVLPKGVIPISWKILENGDGVLLNILHSNAEEISFTLNGAIENQGILTADNPSSLEVDPDVILFLLWFLIFSFLGGILSYPFYKNIKAIYLREFEGKVIYVIITFAMFGGGIFCFLLGISILKVIFINPYGSMPF